MAKLRVHRKGYTRKGGVHVGPTTFLIKDRGKRGRTPEAERWYHPTVETGWRKTDTAETRRRKALRAHGGDELAAARGLQSLANVTLDTATKRLARADALYFYRRHAEE